MTTKAPPARAPVERFYKLPQALAARRDLPASAKIVYTAILDRFGRNGHSWPGYERIGRDCGLARRTVMRAIASLSAANPPLLVVGNRGNGRSNDYRLPVETSAKLTPVADADQCQIDTPTSAKMTPLPVPKWHPNQTDQGNQTHAGTAAPTVEGTETGTGNHNTPDTAVSEKKEAPPAAKPPSPRRRDPHGDAFKAAFDATFPDAYAWQAGDFAQLATWRKNYPGVTPERYVSVARLHWQRGKYTPAKSKTIRGLCADWAQLAAYTAPAPAARPVPLSDAARQEFQQLGIIQ